jgi:hypothetical protein
LLCGRVTFFPDDFHQPLASLIMTLSDRQQRTEPGEVELIDSAPTYVGAA